MNLPKFVFRSGRAGPREGRIVGGKIDGIELPGMVDVVIHDHLDGVGASVQITFVASDVQIRPEEGDG